ncbi:hypothetical protein SAMN04488018_11754 [Myroides marinus]|uniref:Uncharacterized protein n=1 Tax=Myroides marinus TaxID=703342 RepID=A0A1H6XBN5_9FLAO|nr:hypothetical protein SAMN04488018_11754 [Myroides marinus]
MNTATHRALYQSFIAKKLNYRSEISHPPKSLTRSLTSKIFNILIKEDQEFNLSFKQ